MIEAYNPRYAPLLEGRAVQGHPLEEVIELFWHDKDVGARLVRLAREVYRQEATRTLPRVLTTLAPTHGNQHEKDENYFTYTMVPSHDASGRVDGVIVYAIDESEQPKPDLALEGVE